MRLLETPVDEIIDGWQQASREFRQGVDEYLLYR
jgi:hypothetical protein